VQLNFGYVNEVHAQTTNSNRINDLLSQLDQETNDTSKTLICIELAELYAQSNYKLAAKYALRAVEYSEPIIFSSARFQALTTVGDIFINSGEKQIAVDYFIQFIKEAKEFGDQLNLEIGYFNLGSAWLGIGEVAKAEKMLLAFEKSVLEERGEKIDAYDTLILMSLYCNMINIAILRKDIGYGTRYFEKGSKIAASNEKLTNLKGLLFFNYGYLLMEKLRHDEAIAYFDTAMVLFRKTNDMAQVGMSLRCLGSVYDAKNNAEKARQYLLDSYRIGLDLNNDPLIEESAQSLYDYYKTREKADSTLKYLTILNEVKARKKESEAREKLLSQELRWEYEEQQRLVQEKNRENWIRVIFLALVMAGVFVYLVLKNKRRLKRIRLENYNLELSAEKLRLDNELLHAQLEMKDKQLATEVLYRIQNNEVVREMVQKLVDAKSQPQKEVRASIDKVVQHLERTIEETAWEEFELRFLQVHTDFYDKLQENCPDLSVQQRRLCAFIKLNMTTKDIATITGQSPHSIVVARSRLRKKLGLLDTDMALVAFINSL
jgi:tetratricopeptide (TPR) repeat protein